MISQVDKKIREYGLSNFMKMIEFCEIVQIKWPILELLTIVIQKNLLGDEINLNILVLKTLYTTEIRTDDEKTLRKFLRMDGINETTRTIILGIISVTYSDSQ